jgi:hypothetical protein
MDSVATAFEVQSPDELTYYLAGGREPIQRIMGIDWTVGGTGVGYASRANRMVFSGEPAFGENHRHELAHFVLQPLHARGTHPLASEGVATWLGGAMGRDFHTLAREYADFVRAHPEVTLDDVLDSDARDLGSRPGGAILVLLVFERGGVSAVKELLAGGRSASDLRQSVTGLTGLEWPVFAHIWRERAIAAGGGDAGPFIEPTPSRSARRDRVR